MDKFLNEYRDRLQILSLTLKSLDRELSRSERYVIDVNDNKILEGFLSNMLYIDERLVESENHFKSLFRNIYQKLEKLTNIAEGYQKFNTNELNDDSIYNFSIFDIQDRQNYDNLLQGLTLPRKNLSKGISTKDVIRAHVEASETFKLPYKRVSSSLNINVIDSKNTILKRVIFYTSKGEEIKSFASKTFVEIPHKANTVRVFTDNVDKDRPNYTKLDIYKNQFIDKDTTTFDDVSFKKEGKLLKLVIDSVLPDNCDMTYKLSFRYNHKGDLKQETVFFSGKADDKVRVETSEAQGRVKDAKGNILNYSDLSTEDYVLTNSFSTNPEGVQYLGNKVFNITRIPVKDFKVSLSVDLFSLVDETKTPIIKGIYGYVTD